MNFESRHVTKSAAVLVRSLRLQLLLRCHTSMSMSALPIGLTVAHIATPLGISLATLSQTCLLLACRHRRRRHHPPRMNLTLRASHCLSQMFSLCLTRSSLHRSISITRLHLLLRVLYMQGVPLTFRWTGITARFKCRRDLSNLF